jgi:hypothetical protein
MILTTEEFQEFAEAYPELAECVCLDEFEYPLNGLCFNNHLEDN